MKFYRISTCILSAGLLAATQVYGSSSTDDARAALGQQENDTSQEKQLEEVFQAAEKSYSLLKSGDTRLTYSFDYSNFRDSRIDFVQAAGENDTTIVTNFVENSSENSFTNTFSFDYGIWDNLTLSARIPLVAKYSDIKALEGRTYRNKDKTAYGLGDVSLSLRWQPFEVKPGRPSLTLYSSFSTKTGDSPYEMNLAKDIPTGSGYYSLGVGANMSHVLDPVVLFGSVGYTYNFKETGLDQFRGPQDQQVGSAQDEFVLDAVKPGNSYNMNMGFAYSLSYDVSMSASYQVSYTEPSEFKFKTGREVESAASTSGVVNLSLGLRASPTYIVNVNAGFGLTEDSPDILLGFSLPLDLDGLKDE
ncbi:transporter [Parendozoicomonas haliclonae]|uniref:Flagellar protein FilC n=1 Tax=Parendozoicomonas haliclonae TaxID=1960125 RepID=A0A1X7AKL4_9GAMM|nr:transporter [Parendozoicomonas haliclonae]SMA48011.1 hypothetical protein EHSB41UT_02633 [Parendozoicomonas haliclonae]